VKTATGWKDAYKQFCESGWNGVTLPSSFGGQGLPDVLGVAVKEMTNSANMSFALCPLLTAGARRSLAHLRQRRTQGHLSGEDDHR
jgi:alkylation response protein AidB-like acyl-CoA dehydrogenase